MEMIYPTGPSGLAVFVFVTLMLAGAAAFATGRAVASKWQPLWQLVVFVGLLTLACRFLHYALFHQPFLDLRNVAVDFVVLLVIALAGFRLARQRQMVGQYPWLFEASGPMSWRRRSDASH